jgi:Family of unknown function (DUF6879)
VTGDELLDAYRCFTHDAIRLETLQHYEVPGDEDRQRAFRAGKALPRRPDKSASVQIIRDAVAAGKRIGRIHVIDWPLSDYVRYEIEAAYLENSEAGEQILISDRAADPGLDHLRQDFVLFDGDTDHASVIWYRYTDRGEITGWDAGTPCDVAPCREAVALARRNSVTLSEFLASTPSRSH